MCLLISTDFYYSVAVSPNGFMGELARRKFGSHEDVSKFDYASFI